MPKPRFAGPLYVALLCLLLVAAGAISMLLEQVPGTALMHDAETLSVNSWRLRSAILEAQLQPHTSAPDTLLMMALVDQAVTRVRGSLKNESPDGVPCFQRFEAVWQANQLRLKAGARDTAILDALADQADRADDFSRGLKDFVGNTRARLVGVLKLLLAFSVVATLALILILLRQRRLAGDALRQFSLQLRQGHWRKAIAALRRKHHGQSFALGALAQELEGVLTSSEQRWRARADMSADWYWRTDADHRLTSPEPSFARRFPALAAQVRAGSAWHSCAVPLEGAEAGWSQYLDALNAHRPFREFECAVPLADGGTMWISLCGDPLFSADGHFLGYHGVGRDVSRFKQSEQILVNHNEELRRAVAERTIELQQVNAELDAFARQVAHELRTPIGQVHALAELLEKRIGTHFGVQVREWLLLQARVAHGMAQTVTALLELARSGVEPLHLEEVDLTALAQQVIEAFPLHATRVAPVDWQLQKGMKAMASPAALRMVLSNLLGNAAKFTRDQDKPVVVFGQRRNAQGQTVWFVQDNGVGFGSDKASRLFKPFTRLHSEAEFQGTGIGLTIVQRIIERHGGAIVAQGEAGQGACFEFSLGAAQPARVASGLSQPATMPAAAAQAIAVN